MTAHKDHSLEILIHIIYAGYNGPDSSSSLHTCSLRLKHQRLILAFCKDRGSTVIAYFTTDQKNQITRIFYILGPLISKLNRAAKAHQENKDGKTTG